MSTEESTHIHIKSYFFDESTFGIVRLTFVTYDRWIQFYRFSNTLYGFGDDCDHAMSKALEIQIPTNIDLKHKMCAVEQNADHITFFYIPNELLNSQDKE